MVENELDSMNLPFIAKAAGPPWLPGPVAEARKLTYWAQWVMVVLGLAFFISGIVALVFHNPAYGIYGIATAVVYALLLFLMKSSFFGAVDQGRFREAHDKLLIFMILGIIFMLVPGLIMLIAYIRMNEVFAPNYQPYPAGQYQAGAPPPQQQPQYQAPPPQQAPAAPQPPAQEAAAAQPEQRKADMVKCKKCGVQYPAFMRTCPNCNEPR